MSWAHWYGGWSSGVHAQLTHGCCQLLPRIRLQFAMIPPSFNGMLASVANRALAQVLEEGILSLLNKHVIGQVQSQEIHQGFYSQYHVNLKKGALIPVAHSSLAHINVQNTNTQSTLLHQQLVCDDHCAAEAYFEIAIYLAHRKFLRFTYQEVAYDFQAISFCLCLAPMVFSKCVTTVLFPLRNGISSLSLPTYCGGWDRVPECH